MRESIQRQYKSYELNQNLFKAGKKSCNRSTFPVLAEAIENGF